MRRRVQAGVEQFAFALNAEALTNFAYASYKKTHDVAVQLGQLYHAHRPMRSYYLCRLQLRRRGPAGQLVHVDGAHGAVDRRRHGHRHPRLYQYGNGAVRYFFTQNLPFDPWASTRRPSRHACSRFPS